MFRVSFYILFCGVVLSSNVTAHTLSDTLVTKKNKHYFGFSLGYTLAELSGSQIDLSINDPGAYMEKKYGIDIAFVYKYEFNNYFFLKSGGGINTKRSYARNSGFIYPLQAELTFFSIPLIVGIQPINLANSQRINLTFESGLIANLDAGSSDNMGPGLHPNNKVNRNTLVPAFIIGGGIEIKLTPRAVLTFNARKVNDLKDYYERVYEVYDTDTNDYIYYHYNYRISSTHITIGMIFIPKNK